jgi:reactive intermediate/imine deaminase
VPLSPAVRAGDFVYVSGQVPVGSDGIVVKGGITEQTEQVLANVKAALALAGCTLDDVVKTTVWLEDARDFGAFNAVYARHFPKNPPARTAGDSGTWDVPKVCLGTGSPPLILRQDTRAASASPQI